METEAKLSTSLVPMARTQAVLMLEAAYLWMDLGKYDSARDILTGAAALMPKNEVPQLALGTLEFVEGRLDKSLAAYRNAARLAPKSAVPRAHAGEALLFMGKVNEAKKELEAALELEPGTPGAELAAGLLEAVALGLLPPQSKAAEKR